MVSKKVIYTCGLEGRNHHLPLTTLDQGSQYLDFQGQPGPGQFSYWLSAGGDAMKGKGVCVCVCVCVHTCAHTCAYTRAQNLMPVLTAKDSNQVELTSLPCVGKRVRERRSQ